ncbi:MAG: hypothetical protein A3I05_05925 [Deltaproteobacteria bacterium RIFCSPLOWO2_02_FULL_44_10]|nr:MAG: hypothetical protein A3C46_04750 [Deltaproteobacteria bacterium RIFCSPHIGHO2_02_FULL_44_16]OGQ46142.1 MAG: hypothetical protein A3I05_05925 [Deltaproteobacteria bacterium RIFCSPLOWO2_02_FULL_44_10]
MDFDAKLQELYIDLPEPISSPLGIVPFHRIGKILFLPQTFPFAEGKLIAKGRVGVDLRLDTARLGARAALLSSLGILQAHLRTLNKLKQFLHLDGFIVSGADFQDHEKVFDGASDLLRQIFGKVGEHSRNILGVSSLPRGAAVCVSLSVEVK